jgi:hypothetical protein
MVHDGCGVFQGVFQVMPRKGSDWFITKQKKVQQNVSIHAPARRGGFAGCRSRHAFSQKAGRKGKTLLAGFLLR